MVWDGLAIEFVLGEEFIMEQRERSYKLLSRWTAIHYPSRKLVLPGLLQSCVPQVATPILPELAWDQGTSLSQFSSDLLSDGSPRPLISL